MAEVIFILDSYNLDVARDTIIKKVISDNPGLKIKDYVKLLGTTERNFYRWNKNEKYIRKRGYRSNKNNCLEKTIISNGIPKVIKFTS